MHHTKIGDVQKAVAKECHFLEDSSKKTITEITKLYLKQIEKDGHKIKPHLSRVNTNARRVNFFMSKL